jgi:hypothetical protein
LINDQDNIIGIQLFYLKKPSSHKIVCGVEVREGSSVGVAGMPVADGNGSGFVSSPR